LQRFSKENKYMQTHFRAGRARRSLKAVAAAAGLAMLLAACAGTGEAANSGGSNVDQAGLAEASSIVTEYTQRPTEIPNDEPITAPIPKGKNITFLSCGTSTCNLEAEIIEEATNALGWTLTTISNDGTPEKVKAAWQQILRTKPDGVIYTATDRAIFEAELTEAAKMGIEVVACCTTDPADGEVLDFVIGTPEQTTNVGRVMAAWVTEHSQGEGDAVYVDLSAFKIIGAIRESFNSSMAELCSGCTTDKLDIPITALGKDVPDRIVSYLRSHPEVKYVVLSVDGALGAGLPAALKSAGLNDVEVIGEGPDENTLQYISSGQQTATAAFPYYEEMFSLVDALARKFAGVPMEAEVTVPDWIVTADNLPTAEKIFPLVTDVKEQYFTLWGVK
jgi:ABC-type sugar transport system substrate-binding protein